MNIKYIEKPKNSSKKIFKQQLLKNGTADFFAFTIIFQENTSSLCRNCLLRGAFLKKGTMLIGRSGREGPGEGKEGSRKRRAKGRKGRSKEGMEGSRDKKDFLKEGKEGPKEEREEKEMRPKMRQL